MPDNTRVRTVTPIATPTSFEEIEYTVKSRELVDGSKVQGVQIDIGTGTATSPVTPANPLPVSGTVTATIGTLPLPTGASTSALQTTGNTSLSNIYAELQKLNSLVPARWDNFTCSYTGVNLTGVVFKLGAATVATITLTYDGSNNLLTGSTA
jgi:hypothetical protein